MLSNIVVTSVALAVFFGIVSILAWMPISSDDTLRVRDTRACAATRTCAAKFQ